MKFSDLLKITRIFLNFIQDVKGPQHHAPTTHLTC